MVQPPLWETILLCGVLFVNAIGQDEPHLLVRKQIAHSPMVAKQEEFAVSYEIFNAGTSTAFDVRLDDTRAWSEHSFECTVGLLVAEWVRIPPGVNVTHVVFLKMNVADGVVYGVPAAYTYRNANGNLQVGTSTTSASKYVIPIEYNRKHKGYQMEWIVYITFALGLICIPFHIERKIKNNDNR